MPLNEKGWEVPDATPITRAVKFGRAPSTLDEVRRALGILTKEAEEHGFETPEEADDFNVGDDFDPTDVGTRWEVQGDERFEEALQLARQDVERQKSASGVAPGAPGAVVPGDPPGDRPDVPAATQPPVPVPAPGVKGA